MKISEQGRWTPAARTLCVEFKLLSGWFSMFTFIVKLAASCSFSSPYFPYTGHLQCCILHKRIFPGLFLPLRTSQMDPSINNSISCSWISLGLCQMSSVSGWCTFLMRNHSYHLYLYFWTKFRVLWFFFFSSALCSRILIDFASKQFSFSPLLFPPRICFLLKTILLYLLALFVCFLVFSYFNFHCFTEPLSYFPITLKIHL